MNEKEFNQFTGSLNNYFFKDKSPKLLSEKLITITKSESGNFSYELSFDGLKCNFLQFLINCSDFNHIRTKIEENTIDDINLNSLNLVSKLACIGYMYSEKDLNFTRAVIANNSSKSKGQNGKSLFGRLFEFTSKHDSAFVIQGRSRRINSPFVWDGLDLDTPFVIIDDLYKGYEFEKLFSCISGDWTCNPKGAKSFTIPREQTPRIYISTEFDIEGVGCSFKDRIWNIYFSDYYSQYRTPHGQFNRYLFETCNSYDQHNYIFNLVYECVDIFKTFGYVESPKI